MYKTNKIEILENGTLQVREIETLELTDGTVREGGYRRFVLTPDMDINSIECERCKAIATAEWTPEVVEAYKASIKVEEPALAE